MKKVLTVANLFHASPRIPGLAKYLPDFGWKPIVLTGSPPEHTFGKGIEYIQTRFPNIFDLWKKRLHLNPSIGFQKQIGVPFSIRQNRKSITTTMVNAIKVVIAYPDEHKEWRQLAIKAANKLLEREIVEAIISSSSPVTSHVIANALKTEHGIPWAADLRDLWSQNHNYHYGRFRQIFDRGLELKTLRKADALITASPLWAEQLRRLHGREFVYSITNGFDPDHVNTAPMRVTPEFTITYTGTIYESKQDTGIFFAALKDLLSDRIIKPEDVRIRFFGHQSERVAWEITKFGLTNLVQQYEQIDRELAFQRQRESQLLLLFYWNDPRIKGWYPLKTFEYLAAQRPILVIGGSGDDVVQKLLQQTKSGIYCKKPEDIKTALKEAYFEYKHKGRIPYNGDMQTINKYNYREMARKFAQVLDSITKKTKR